MCEGSDSPSSALDQTFPSVRQHCLAKPHYGTTRTRRLRAAQLLLYTEVKQEGLLWDQGYLRRRL